MRERVRGKKCPWDFDVARNGGFVSWKKKSKQMQADVLSALSESLWAAALTGDSLERSDAS